MTEKYELLVKLGQGAFAQVYKARHKELGYIRAVRILNEFIKNEQDSSYIKFLKECKLLLRLGNGCNPNIVRVYQPCFSEHHAMVEMDFIDGDDIFHYIKKNGGFVPIKEIMKFLHDISSALAYCHEDVYKYCMNVVDDNLECDPDDASHFLIDDTKRQELINKYRVIHNDIHSGNIMRHRNGDYILLDFGIAIEGNEVARASCITNGAPEFKSPEKWEERDHLSTQSDIYSFGIILYEMLAGKVPFEYDQSNSKVWEAENQLRIAHLKETPKPVFNARKSAYEKAHPGKKYVQDYPDWLEKLVMKCLEKKPSDRFANGKELHNHYLAQLGRNDLLVNQEKEINALKEEVEALKKELINSAGNNAQKNQAANPLSNNSAAKLGRKAHLHLSSATGIFFGHEYVDLGLPSGLKWATCNIGASSPDGYGDYYSWGNVNTYYMSDEKKYNKFLGDIKGNSSYDVARKKWGGSWMLPSEFDFQELIDNCTWEWITAGLISGYKVTGCNGNSIFLPAAGWRSVSNNEDGGFYGCYWSSMQEKDDINFADHLYFCRKSQSTLDSPHDFGFPIRPVCKVFEISEQQKGIPASTPNIARSGYPDEVKEENNASEKPKNSDDGSFIRVLLLSSVAIFAAIMLAVILGKTSCSRKKYAYETSGILNGHYYVDLGLPSGTLWAVSNLGASEPDEYGYVYDYSDVTGGERNKDISGNPNFDEATEKWGAPWRMPKRRDLDELMANCTWYWTSYNGVNGYVVTGPNYNKIFLPAAGWGEGDGGRSWAGISGRYWSGTFDVNDMYCLRFDKEYHILEPKKKQYKFSIRPVCNR